MPSDFALKEWAVVVDALADGRQTITLRKGGIAEKHGAFDVEAEAFFLFPTFLHQDPGAIREEERFRFAQVAPPPEGAVLLPARARILDVREVPDETTARALAAETIWTEDYLARRFHLMPKRPLFALRLEVERLDPPQRIPARAEYDGCASWVRLLDATESAEAASKR